MARTLRERKAIVAKAKKLLRSSPKQKAMDKAVEREIHRAEVKRTARQTLEREKAVEEMERVLSEIEEDLRWLLYGRGNW